VALEALRVTLGVVYKLLISRKIATRAAPAVLLATSAFFRARCHGLNVGIYAAINLYSKGLSPCIDVV
jgi:hypothetical protein